MSKAAAAAAAAAAASASTNTGNPNGPSSNNALGGVSLSGPVNANPSLIGHGLHSGLGANSTNPYAQILDLGGHQHDAASRGSTTSDGDGDGDSSRPSQMSTPDLHAQHQHFLQQRGLAGMSGPQGPLSLHGGGQGMHCKWMDCSGLLLIIFSPGLPAQSHRESPSMREDGNNSVINFSASAAAAASSASMAAAAAARALYSQSSQMASPLAAHSTSWLSAGGVSNSPANLSQKAHSNGGGHSRSNGNSGGNGLSNNGLGGSGNPYDAFSSLHNNPYSSFVQAASPLSRLSLFSGMAAAAAHGGMPGIPNSFNPQHQHSPSPVGSESDSLGGERDQDNQANSGRGGSGGNRRKPSGSANGGGGGRTGWFNHKLMKFI